jgi:hypothetical protein
VRSLDDFVAEAVLGIDTLWGGDVLNPSGTGRFIADSWFSDRPLPEAYTHPAAARLRQAGGVSAKKPDQAALDAYLKAVDVHGAIEAVAAASQTLSGLRGAYLHGLALCFEVMWDLAKELLDRGDPVPYERCVRASTGAPPEPSDPDAKRKLVAALLREAGFPLDSANDMVAAADAWRRRHAVAAEQIPALSASCIAELDALAERHLVPYLPEPLGRVPRANIRFLPIRDAWFSGSMNYLGRARTPEGKPEYEASYEINASLQISQPEFRHLVSHEVVPGHVTTFAFLQDLFWRGEVGFEASVLTMNTRCAALFEGIANNAMLIAHGVTEVKDLPDRDLQIGVILALLQDDAKNEASYLTWQQGLPQGEVARLLRRGFLVSEERADKLSGAWGRHPLLGRMYLPAYRAGTETVARLRRLHPPETVLPALYGCRGLVDLVTLQGLLGAGIA